MFKKKERKPGAQAVMSVRFINFSYLVASVCFILALQGCARPSTRAAACSSARSAWPSPWSARCSHHEIVTYKWIILGFIVGSLIGTRHVDLDPDDQDARANRVLARVRRPRGGARRRRASTTSRGDAGHLGRVTLGALGLEVFLGF